MSEFFYGPLDSDEELEENPSDTLSFLDNAKLIGETPSGLSIYLEDYVYTYLYQYSKINRGEEKGAALVGYYTEEFGDNMLIINGAIQFDKSASKDEGMLTEAQMDQVIKQMEKYFSDCEIVGWMHTQPGYGIFLTTQDIRLQQEFFGDSHQVLMIIDPIENTEAFFVWDKEEVRSSEGYYIYYDKNEQMQNYMVNHKVGTSNEELKEDEKDVVMHFRKKDKMRRQEIQNRKVANLVTALSVVLFLMCVTMAIGLIQHRERITKLETELEHMDSNYTDLLGQLSEENVQVVFAENEATQVPEETAKVNTEVPDTNDIVKVETEDKVVEEEKTTQEPVVEQKAVEEPKETPTKAAAPTEEVAPKATQKADNANEFDTYTVKKGDNLNRICYQHYNTTEVVDKIVEFNGLDSPNKIIEGQVIKLPKL